jgi:hypothetical protein
MRQFSVRPVHDRRARLASSVHGLLQAVEEALFGAYVRSVRAQARLSGFPLPVTQLGIQRGSGLAHGRGVGTFARWAAIEKELPSPPGFALDIGSHTGFFSLALAERGFLVLGCEPSRRLFRIATAAADHAGQPSVAFMPIAVEPANVATLPQSDIVLVLSVFHDWCERFGFEQSLEMLDAVWQKTRMTLFFEMPNTVENSSVRTVLPDMGATPEAAKNFIENLLSRLVGGDVALLGHFATDFRGAGERRHLFAIRRSSYLPSLPDLS